MFLFEGGVLRRVGVLLMFEESVGLFFGGGVLRVLHCNQPQACAQFF